MDRRKKRSKRGHKVKEGQTPHLSPVPPVPLHVQDWLLLETILKAYVQELQARQTDDLSQEAKRLLRQELVLAQSALDRLSEVIDGPIPADGKVHLDLTSGESSMLVHVLRAFLNTLRKQKPLTTKNAALLARVEHLTEMIGQSVFPAD